MRNTNGKTKAWRFGRFAEFLCAFSLAVRGYRILARRFKTPVGEIDLIARRGTLLVFIEVKARSDLSAAAASITPRQQQRISRAAGAFLKARPGLSGLDMRFDAMLVRPWSWPLHLPGAWRVD